MHILILCNSLGGLYKFRREMVERLLAENHRVTISAPQGRFQQEIEEMGAILVPYDADNHGTNPAAEFKTYLYYKRLLKEQKPDMVFTYTIKPNIYGGIACGRKHVPYIMNITGLGTAVESKNRLQFIATKLYKMGMKNAQRIFCQNRDNMRFICEKGLAREEQTDLLPGSGVNLNQYEVLDYPAGPEVNFCFISRIMKEKGIEQYLEAAQAIHSKYPFTCFHICGGYENAYKERLLKLQEEGVIKLHGYVKDTVEIHRISQCTIHPTFYPEGMSNVLLESCACARPVITTDRPGCKEAVDDGVNGFIVKQRDSADLIEKIERFLALPVEKRREMGLAGRAKVEKEFDRNIVIEKYMAELARVAKKG